MRVLVQRVRRASVTIEGLLHSQIEEGLLIFLGIEQEDTEADIEPLCQKLAKLRIFADEQGAMNRSVLDVDGNCLLISQFTLHAKTRKGNRPSFIRAARPEQAKQLYEQFASVLSTALGKPVATGVFAADMQVELLNDGPVTIFMDSKNWD